MLPKTADYALRAVVLMGRKPDLAQSASHLAERTKVPRHYLHKVLQDLVRGGLVRSQPGPGGGYSLTRPPEEITILDVVNAVGEVERIDRCPMGLSADKCPHAAPNSSLCSLHQELDNVYASAQEALRRVTIASLACSDQSQVPTLNSAAPIP